jgi:hypothetical protein
MSTAVAAGGRLGHRAFPAVRDPGSVAARGWVRAPASGGLRAAQQLPTHQGADRGIRGRERWRDPTKLVHITHSLERRFS